MAVASKYKYNSQVNGNLGFKEVGCGCAGKKVSQEVVEISSDKTLLYIGQVDTNIRGYAVKANALLLNVESEDYDKLITDPRFREPTENELKTKVGYFGK